LREENPGAFLQPQDLSNRVFFDAPGGHLDNSPLPSSPKHIKPRGDLETFREAQKKHAFFTKRKYGFALRTPCL
ncbi:hypothetical protein, partial [Ferrovum sp.]|uniref:hypothetical protein n=1 Tax=Ferrovum sp. TaxID=2609467 RepID=UPI00260D38F9